MDSVLERITARMSGLGLSDIRVEALGGGEVSAGGAIPVNAERLAYELERLEPGRHPFLRTVFWLAYLRACAWPEQRRHPG
jgi:hypothetical protein